MPWDPIILWAIIRFSGLPKFVACMDLAMLTSSSMIAFNKTAMGNITLITC